MYFLIADGGYKPTGGYGSYVLLKGRTLTPNVHAYFPLDEIEHRTFDLPTVTTNNQAEYAALISGLTAALSRRAKGVVFKVLMDSELVVRQINGRYKCKDRELGKLKRDAQHLLAQFENITLSWVDKSLVEEYLGH